LVEIANSVIMGAVLPALITYLVERTGVFGAARAFQKVLGFLKRNRDSVAVHDEASDAIIIWDAEAQQDAENATLELIRHDWNSTREGWVFRWDAASGRWRGAPPGSDASS